MDIAGFVPDVGDDRLFGITTAYWHATFVDDLPLQRNVRDRSIGAPFPDVIAPDAVGDWLRSSGLDVGDAEAIPVDGRIALRYDVEGGDVTLSGVPCDDVAVLWPSGSGIAASAGFAYYAIPIGDDTILFIVWSDDGSRASTRAGADLMVRSMRFEP